MLVFIASMVSGVLVTSRSVMTSLIISVSSAVPISIVIVTSLSHVLPSNVQPFSAEAPAL